MLRVMYLNCIRGCSRPSPQHTEDCPSNSHMKGLITLHIPLSSCGVTLTSHSTLHITLSSHFHMTDDCHQHPTFRSTSHFRLVVSHSHPTPHSTNIPHPTFMMLPLTSHFRPYCRATHIPLWYDANHTIPLM